MKNGLVIARHGLLAVLLCSLAGCGGGGGGGDPGAGAGVGIGSGGGTVVQPAVTAPTITGSPQAQTVIAGQTASFAVTAAGSTPLNYQWLRNGADISGATQPSYSLTAAAADNGASFSVRVVNSAGSVTSSAAPLTVTPLPSLQIAQQPASASVVVGQTATFTVGASSSAGGALTYQWRRDGANLAGATQPSYTTTTLEMADSGAHFSVVVRQDSLELTSGEAVLTVTAPAVTATGARLAAGSEGTAGFSLALRADGTAYGWGENALFQTTDGPALTGSSARVLALPARAVAAGERHALLIGGDGLVYGWGSTLSGELVPEGNAAGQQVLRSPRVLPGLDGAIAVLATSQRSWALSSDGTVWHWPGVYSNGAPPFASFSVTPGQVGGITSPVRRIVRGGRSPNGGTVPAFAIGNDGSVWDITVSTTLAFPVTTHVATASRVAALSDIRDLACSASHCLAVHNDGSVLAWGSNERGQLGRGSGGDSFFVPVPVLGLSTARSVATIAQASAALLADGRVWTWGAGSHNGRGGADLEVPEELPQPQGVAEIAASGTHLLLRLASGQVWGWGGNASGELGDGTLLPRSTPVQVQGLTLE